MEGGNWACRSLSDIVSKHLYASVNVITHGQTASRGLMEGKSTCAPAGLTRVTVELLTAHI